MNDEAEARLTGRDVAAADVEKILSYDHASFDKGTTEAEKLMTARFRKEYGDTVGLVREDALAKKSVVQAEVVASSVVEADADRVEALLFVNQTTRRPGPRRAPGRPQPGRRDAGARRRRRLAGRRPRGSLNRHEPRSGHQPRRPLK